MHNFCLQFTDKVTEDLTLYEGSGQYGNTYRYSLNMKQISCSNQDFTIPPVSQDRNLELFADLAPFLFIYLLHLSPLIPPPSSVSEMSFLISTIASAQEHEFLHGILFDLSDSSCLL